MYEETAPSGSLRDVARCVWRSASSGPKRIVPDGCVDLVAGDGEAFVAGPDTTAWSSVTRPGVVLSGIRFHPGCAAAVLGVAADELRDRRVPLGELWGRAGERVAERLAAGELTPAQAVASRLAEVPPPDPAAAELIARLDAGAARVADAAAGLIRRGAAGPGVAGLGGSGLGGSGLGGSGLGGSGLGGSGEETARAAAMFAEPEAAATLGRAGAEAAQVAAALGRAGASRPDAVAGRGEDPVASLAVSERGLRRRFVQAVGYGPATYLRVSRFQRAVALAPRVANLAALAAAAGYADQAHLSRDCRALTGLTPRGYFGGPSTVDVAVRDRRRSA
ncbi:helix-turn-helix domain-containing protein [Amycolatopsis sp. NPDC026612]|uniref:helix-turn-helix domain-containing protein n=1 Tax=Amycolatopsis sp. NPDC026612 TaxID=3155466 RepID=UPI0033C4B742